MWVFPRNFDRHIDKKLGTCCGCKKLLCQDQNQLLLVQIVDVVYKMIYEMTFFSFCSKHNTTLERKKICWNIHISTFTKFLNAQHIFFSSSLGKKVSKNAFLKRKYARTKWPTFKVNLTPYLIHFGQDNHQNERWETLGKMIIIMVSKWWWWFGKCGK